MPRATASDCAQALASHYISAMCLVNECTSYISSFWTTPLWSFSPLQIIASRTSLSPFRAHLSRRRMSYAVSIDHHMEGNFPTSLLIGSQSHWLVAWHRISAAMLGPFLILALYLCFFFRLVLFFPSSLRSGIFLLRAAPVGFFLLLLTGLLFFLCRLVGNKKRLTLPSRATMMTSWAACFDVTSFTIRGACWLVEK